jgi:3-dehydroquinate dehydratase type I
VTFRICVTGAEASPAALLARQRATKVADLQELRLDLLDDPHRPPREVITPHRRFAVLVTCRPRRQGGGFDGPEEERLAILTRWATRSQADLLDLEDDVDEDDAAELVAAARGGGLAVVRSTHVFGHGGEPSCLLDRLSSLPGDVLKLAIQVSSMDELAHLEEVAQVDWGAPHVVVGMGRLGAVSRREPWRFRSLWTYASLPGQGTAPGQLPWEEALIRRRYRNH